MAENILIALGTNLGDRKNNLDQALAALEKENIFNIHTVSHIYETEPWGYLDQNPFLNMVIQGTSDYSPVDLLTQLKTLEVQLGRSPTFHYGPRVIDLDILFYDDKVIHTPQLKIPHPEMQSRDFVLFPLCEIAPYFIHPQTKQTASEMLKQLPKSNIKLMEYPEIHSSFLRELILNPPKLKNYLSNISNLQKESQNK